MVSSARLRIQEVTKLGFLTLEACPETSLRNRPEERSSYLLCGGSLKSCCAAVKSSYNFMRILRWGRGGGPANFEAMILRNVAMNGTNLTVELPMEILITRTANRLNVWPNFSQFMVTLINFSRRD